ncbi:MAG TPA: hypothetical protein VGJ45_31685 [Pseudonocardiaceae bacterium]
MAAAAATDGGGGSAPPANSTPSSGGLLGQSIINELTAPANVHLDDTGENRLKKLQPLIDALKDLGPLYEKWRGCKVAKGGWTEPAYGPGVEAQQIPPLNTINFGAIYSPYARMSQMHSAGQALETIAQNGAGALPQYWAGAAADAATTKLNDLKYASQEYTQTLESLSPHVMGLWTTTTNAVQKLADFGTTNGDAKSIIEYSKDLKNSSSIDGHSMDMGAANSYIDQMNLAVQFGLYQEFWSGNYEPASDAGSSDKTVSEEQLRNAGVCELDGGHGSWWTDQASSWYDKFADTYQAAAKGLRAQITQTYQGVDQALSDFTGQISGIPADPFGKLQAPGAAPAQSSNGTSNGTSNGNTGGSHTGGSSPSTGGGGGTSASSFTPPPTSPSTVGAGGGGAGAGGGTTPGQGGVPTIPPISTTGSPVGTPVGTTTPQGAQGTPESMTVQSGSNQISMTSPDSQGNVQLTVHNGSGTQSYNIGFGGQGTGTPGAPSQTVPGQVPGQGVPQQITPGADGHAVIHDGNLTITATEPQGGHGPVQVTVDDGTGHPSTYTLNPGSGAAGGGTPMQPLSGTNPAGAAYPGSGGTQGGYGIPAGASQQGYAVPAGGQSYGGDTSGAAYQTGAAYDPSSAAAASYQPDPGTQSAAWLPPGGDPSSHADAASNLTQGFGGGVGGGGGGGSALAGHAGLGGAVPGAPISPADHTGGMVSSAASNHEVSGVGLANTNVDHPGAAGGAGMAGGPGDAGGQPAGGGAPMMGGMGGMGGGGQGQDQERGASQWRVRGDLFGDADGPLEVPRVIGDEDQ